MNAITIKQMLGMSFRLAKIMFVRFKVTMELRAAERDIDLYMRQINEAQNGLRIRSLDCAILKAKLMDL